MRPTDRVTRPPPLALSVDASVPHESRHSQLHSPSGLHKLLACRVSGLPIAIPPGAYRRRHLGFRQPHSCPNAGHELDEATAALVPATAIGRMIDQEEAAKLIRGDLASALCQMTCSIYSEMSRPSN
jgi:hypothetical protein